MTEVISAPAAANGHAPGQTEEERIAERARKREADPMFATDDPDEVADIRWGSGPFIPKSPRHFIAESVAREALTAMQAKLRALSEEMECVFDYLNDRFAWAGAHYDKPGEYARHDLRNLARMYPGLVDRILEGADDDEDGLLSSDARAALAECRRIKAETNGVLVWENGESGTEVYRLTGGAA
jgi:hypothetical protein